MNAERFAHLLRTLCFATTAVLAAGCATSSTNLSVDVDTCCEAQFQRYETYKVSMSEVPGFLGPYLEGGLNTVLEQKGLRPTLDTPDLRVHLLFEQLYLNPDSTEKDTLAESIAPDNVERFLATVKVDVFDVAEDHIVWSGRLNRLHSVPRGEPRGNDHKMQGIIDGFAELFAEYPIRLASISAN